MSVILDKETLELLFISKLVGIISIVFLSLFIIFLIRFTLNIVFKREFEFIHNQIQKGNIAVAIYAGLIISAISFGIIYAITNFLL